MKLGDVSVKAPLFTRVFRLLPGERAEFQDSDHLHENDVHAANRQKSKFFKKERTSITDLGLRGCKEG